MASTTQHIVARGDADLLQRLIAAAEQAGIPSADRWVQQNMGALISAPVQDAQTIADVHAYASAVRAQAVAALPPLPGADPAAVTDAHLAAAIGVVNTPDQPPAQ